MRARRRVPRDDRVVARDAAPKPRPLLRLRKLPVKRTQPVVGRLRRRPSKRHDPAHPVCAPAPNGPCDRHATGSGGPSVPWTTRPHPGAQADPAASPATHAAASPPATPGERRAGRCCPPSSAPPRPTPDRGRRSRPTCGTPRSTVRPRAAPCRTAGGQPATVCAPPCPTWTAVAGSWSRWSRSAPIWSTLVDFHIGTRAENSTQAPADLARGDPTGPRDDRV